MAIKYSTAVRAAMLNAIEDAIGSAPRLLFYSGPVPENCAAPIGTAVLIASMGLSGSAGDFMSSAVINENVVTKSKNPASNWTTSATAAGLVSFYRFWNSAMTVCHEQGTVSETGGGGDMTVDNANIVVNQTMTVLSKTITAGNA